MPQILAPKNTPMLVPGTRHAMRRLGAGTREVIQQLREAASGNKTKRAIAAGSAGAAALELTATAFAADTNSNLTANINGSVESFVPLIVTMVLLAIAIGALYSIKHKDK